MGVYRNYPERYAMLPFVIFKAGWRTNMLISQRALLGNIHVTKQDYNYNSVNKLEK